MKWNKKLTKKEIQHIKNSTQNGTLQEFKRNRKQHKAEMKEGSSEPCWECRIIAEKLGI